MLCLKSATVFCLWLDNVSAYEIRLYNLTFFLIGLDFACPYKET